MKTVGHWVLRIADNDLTWVGFGWLRPAKHARIGVGYILLSSILLGLPGMALGAGLIFLALGRVDSKLALSLFTLVMMIELPLHGLLAHFWNQRAKQWKPESD